MPRLYDLMGHRQGTDLVGAVHLAKVDAGRVRPLPARWPARSRHATAGLASPSEDGGLEELHECRPS